MDHFKNILKVFFISGFGFAGILFTVVALAATGLLDDWMAQTAPEQVASSVIRHAIIIWVFSIPFALVSLAMTPSNLKNLCLWAPFYAPLAVLFGTTLARL